MEDAPELFNLNKIGDPVYATFISRPNRFVGHILVDGKSATCHIADTGRLKEILTDGRKVLVTKNPSKLKTDYRLIACKMNEWVLINTTIHTHIARTAIRNGVLGFVPETIQPEVKVGNSRLDFLIDKNIYVELKGTNLLVNARCRFPDAPSVRAVRHLKELIQLKSEGKEAVILLMGLRDCNCFAPNRGLDPGFADTFREAMDTGVLYRGFRVKLNVESGRVLLNGPLPLCREVFDE